MRHRLRWALRLVVAAAVLLSATLAQAEEPKGLRPVKYVGIEANPLATLAGLYGGQAQFGIYGPIALQAGASYVSMRDTRGCTLDGGCGGGPAVSGVAFEIGPRVHLGLGSGSWSPYLWIAPAYGRDWLHATYADVRPAYPSTKTLPHVDAHSIDRERLILDAGVHVPFGDTGVYFLGGLGFQHALGESSRAITTFERHGLLALEGLVPSNYVRTGRSVRVSCAFGFGF